MQEDFHAVCTNCYRELADGNFSPAVVEVYRHLGRLCEVAKDPDDVLDMSTSASFQDLVMPVLEYGDLKSIKKLIDKYQRKDNELPSSKDSGMAETGPSFDPS